MRNVILNKYPTYNRIETNMIASKKRDETLDFFQKSVMHIYEDIVTTRSVSVWGLLVNSGGFQTMRESKALE